jgi:hypothetical protein
MATISGCRNVMWLRRGNLRSILPRGRRFATFSEEHAQEPITLVFLRHGQSTWNRDNIFIGMTDTPLTEGGIKEAEIAGKLLKKEGLEFDIVYTSLLRRCIVTAWTVLQQIGETMMQNEDVKDISFPHVKYNLRSLPCVYVYFRF